MSFSRDKITNDPNQDFRINRCLYFIFAWSGNADINTGVIQYHGGQHRFVSDTLICIPSASFCPGRCKKNNSVYKYYNLFIACLVDCGDPGTPSNGNRNLTDTLEGSVVSFTCDAGYRPSNESMTRTCTISSDGTPVWTDTIPQCVCKSN